MGIGKAFLQTFENGDVVAAITSTIFIILLGFYMRKKGIFGAQVGKTLTSVVMKLALPALAFVSFMAPINDQTFKQGMGILVWGIVIYVILIAATKIMYIKYDHDTQDVMRVLTMFGSTTFFGIPIVTGIYGLKGAMYASIFNIGYRLFLYSYGYIKMSGEKMDRKNLNSMLMNPIVLATFLGLILWLLQGSMPTLTGTSPITKEAATVAFYRIDVTAPWLYKPLTYLSSLASPLAWLSIGITLGEVSLKDAVKDKSVWYYSFNKVIMVPVINIVLLVILGATGILHLDGTALATIVLMMATPTATVAAAYAISFDRKALLASNASLMSTVVATVAMPFWIVIVQILGQLSMFK
ncbi:AEC family transporter [Weissella viridescens]|uniref:AEC family transporter n=1 Tax=Weissella viridescens TaxID=1629 RepID=UPI0017462C15|nr:AEC family transporter [Weissella viridescens]QOD86360.1 AEC family transporter [Weissella viridescens]WJI91489.1 AEC family transporter [Weissella viridescens]